MRWYKGPPSLSLTEHWNYNDEAKDFFGGYCLYEPGTPAGRVGRVVAGARGCGASRCADEMEKYNHQAGLKIVGEVLPQTRQPGQSCG